jgi:hypothetical protein
MPNLLKYRDGKPRIFPLKLRKTAELPKDKISTVSSAFLFDDQDIKPVRTGEKDANLF